MEEWLDEKENERKKWTNWEWNGTASNENVQVMLTDSAISAIVKRWFCGHN